MFITQGWPNCSARYWEMRMQALPWPIQKRRVSSLGEDRVSGSHLESKVFGIGVEAYTVGSAEFALSYAAFNKDKCIPLMDAFSVSTGWSRADSRAFCRFRKPVAQAAKRLMEASK